jgi:hypothetical protein
MERQLLHGICDLHRNPGNVSLWAELGHTPAILLGASAYVALHE